MLKRNVKIIVVLSLVVLLMGVFTGCTTPEENNTSSEQSSNESNEATNEEKSEAEETKSEDKIVLKLGGGLAETHPHTIAHKFFAEKVKEYSNGRVEVQVFPSNQLGQQRELVQGMQMGTIEMGKSMTAVVATLLPEIKVFDLPYIFRDREHFYKVLDGPIGESFLNEKLASVGLKGLLFYEAGSRSLYNSKKPIKTPEDLEGLKIRVPQNDLMVETINAMGGSGIAMGLAEIYPSLEQNVIDGAENAPLFAYQQKHHEVAKYFSMTDHFRTPDVLMISLKVWEKLDKDAQDSIMKAVEDTKVKQRELWIEQEKEVAKKLKEDGCEFNDVDQEAFRAKVKTVWDKYEKEIGKDLIEQVVNTK